MRIHLILRSMWPKRAHLEDVHVGVVELMGLGDEVCPVIPQIEGLLRGVATEMRVSCCLCSRQGQYVLRQGDECDGQRWPNISGKIRGN